MATSYVKFENRKDREEAVKKLFELDPENNKEDAKLIKYLDKAQDSGGLTVDIGYKEEPRTDYGMVYEKLALHGITGLRYQKQYQREEADWLAIRLRSKEQQEALEEGLKKMGYELG